MITALTDFKSVPLKHLGTPPIILDLLILINNIVGAIGFEPTCNHLLFQLLIRERRYTPIYICAPGRIRTFMCISTVDPKSTGSNQFPHKGVNLREEWESNPFKMFCRHSPISTGPLPNYLVINFAWSRLVTIQLLRIFSPLQ